MNKSVLRVAASLALGTAAVLSLPVAASAATSPETDPALDSHAAVVTSAPGSPALGLWVGAGAAGLAAGAIAVGATVRRNRHDLGA